MPAQVHRTTLDRIFLSITALFVLGGFMALGFLKNGSEENRALFVIVTSMGMMASLACLMITALVWSHLRKWTWQRAITRWNRSTRTNTPPKFILADSVNDEELRRLATLVFTQMGYRVIRTGDTGVYLHLLNPEGRLELVACESQTEAVRLPHINSLDLEMKHTKAVRAFCWAPAGFTTEVKDWVVHRPIVLADRSAIGHLVDCARIKGWPLPEP